jgi:two-component system CheB/CheR fusion protein
MVSSTNSPPKALPPCPIVAIGASKEGTRDLEQILTALPPENEMTFVVLLQQDENDNGRLAARLEQMTPMPVHLAQDGTSLIPGRIFISPAGREMRLEKDILRLCEPSHAARPSAPLDVFLRSVAEQCGENAIAVLLPQMDRDGVLGARAIKNAAGTVLVKSDEGNPSGEVIDTLRSLGLADWSLPTSELVECLTDLGQRLKKSLSCAEPTQDEKGYDELLQIINRHSGHDFLCYKPNTLIRRIQRRMMIRGQDHYTDYLQLVHEDPREIQSLTQDLLIGVTRFFRDEEALDALVSKVLPQLPTQTDEPLRIWVAGCSTGEEAYTLAILLTEFLESQPRMVDFQIFASDLDAEAISFARRGIYPAGIARDLTPMRLQRFFTEKDHHYQVCKSLREKILFAQHNLLKDPPFSRLNLVSCRNLLIYLQPQAQQKLLFYFHQALIPGGYLFLGASEHLGEAAEHFNAVNKKWRLFQRGDSSLPAAQRFSHLGRICSPEIPLPAAPRSAACALSLGTLAEKKLLKEHAPAAAVVNREYEVLHFPSHTGNFLTPPVGEASLNLLKMARKELRPALRSAIHQAFEQKKRICFEEIPLSDTEPSQPLKITADPFLDPFSNTDQDLLVLVVIQESASCSSRALESVQPRTPIESGDKDLMIRYLEEELREKSDQLAQVLGEYESSNEELMSINEEMHSANEELETSREELQALNEELVTVNTELQSKNDELARTTSDMTNLIKSAGISTIFLDRDLKVRRFTPAVTQLFHLIESDLGRPFHHISGLFSTDAILDAARQVLTNLHGQEQEMTADDGRCFILQISPYRTPADVIEGVVISFFDITARKEAEVEREYQRERAETRALEAEESRRILQAITDHIPLGLGVADRHGKLLMISRYGLELGGLRPEQVHQAAVNDYPKLWDMRRPDDNESPQMQELPLIRALQHGEITIGEKWLLASSQGRKAVASVHAAPIRTREGEITGAVVAWSDVTTERRRKIELQQSEQRLKVVIANMPAMVFAADAEGRLMFWNKECERVTGYQAEEVVGNPLIVDRLFIEAEQRRVWMEVCHGASDIYQDLELEIRCRDGSRKTILWGNGSCYCTIPGWDIWGTAIDITERKETEKALQKAREASDNANRAKSDFLANVSHEIRTPLTIIKGAHELLSESPLSSYQHQFLNMAQSSADTLMRLIEDLLDFSRIEARRLTLENTPFDLIDMVETTLAGFAMESAKKKLPIHFHCDESVPRHIIGDSLRLRQVLTNLLSNAVKFTNRGRIDLRISLRRDESIDKNSAMLFFSIEDTGIGIPSDKLSLLFKSFSQVDPSATRRYGGTGLGLAITQRIITLMGGEIWVESTEGEGSRFFFTIPALEAEVVSPAADAEKQSPAPTDEPSETANDEVRILVAEDESMIRHLVGTVLKRKGWTVISARDGKEAISHLENELFDLVLMDIQMPHLDGIEVTRILRQREAEIGRRTPVIALTAHAGEDDRRRFLRAGMDGRITKPIKIGDFLQTIEKILGDRIRQG